MDILGYFMDFLNELRLTAIDDFHRLGDPKWLVALTLLFIFFTYYNYKLLKPARKQEKRRRVVVGRREGGEFAGAQLRWESEETLAVPGPWRGWLARNVKAAIVRTVAVSMSAQPLVLMPKPTPSARRNLPFSFFQAFRSSIPPKDTENKELTYIFRNMRVFGEYDFQTFVNAKEKVQLQLKRGEVLFCPGSKDDSIYVVKQGSLSVFVQDKKVEREEWFLLKTVKEGQALMSLLSVLDVITGYEKPVKTIKAVAEEDGTEVVKLSVAKATEKDCHVPRVVQMLILRITHVTLTSLYRHLGLSQELTMKRKPEAVPIEDISPSPDKDLEVAHKLFLDFLGLPSTDIRLLGTIDFDVYEQGETLMKQGSTDTYLFLVLCGQVAFFQECKESLLGGKDWVVDGYIGAGEIGGELAIVSGDASFFDFRCTVGPLRIAKMKLQDFYNLVESRPKVVLPLAHRIVDQLSPFLRSIDFAIDWERRESGQVLFHQDEAADSLYVVLSGRFRSVKSGKDQEGSRIVEERGKGDALGAMEVLCGTTHPTTIIAVRDSEISAIPVGVLEYIKFKTPAVLMHLFRLKNRSQERHERRMLHPEDAFPHMTNLRTIAILPVSPDVPTSAFATELSAGLQNYRRTLHLSRDMVRDKFKPGNVFETRRDYRLLHWLNEQEDSFGMLVYECDVNGDAAEQSPWTEVCLRQADCILVVGLGESVPTVGRLELSLEEADCEYNLVRAQKELVLLWPDTIKSPYGTSQWLHLRNWVSAHHHIRCPPHLLHGFLSHGEEVAPAFSHLARLLTGNSIGLVLGGGGARGAAHVGCIKAITQFEIPTDTVAGVSIGSLIGAIYCENPTDFDACADRALSWFNRMIWQNLPKDMNLLPCALSRLSGNFFNSTIKDLFGEDKQIEDLWLPFFCVTTDITTSETKIHTSGPLWAYVRASMGLAGTLPPFPDPITNHLLLDGGYVNILPADVMKSMGAKFVVAVDVGAEEKRLYGTYGDSLSGWEVLWNRYWPFGNALQIPTASEIETRLAYVSCVRLLKKVKTASYCYYLRPPVAPYATTDFALYNIITKVAYNFAHSELEGWSKTGKAKALFKSNKGATDEDESPSLLDRPSFSISFGSPTIVSTPKFQLAPSPHSSNS